MILRAYVVGRTGKSVYSKSYIKDESSNHEKVPDFIENIIRLYQNSESTRLEHVYFHERVELVWVFVFFDQFVVVLETTKDESRTTIQRRIISMGRAIASIYGGLEDTQIGDGNLISNFNSIVDRYVELDFSGITDSLLAVIELLTYSALEQYNIAYAGVFDVQGHQIKGNVPENHARKIRKQLSRGTLKPSVDMVPSTLQVDEYKVQMFKVQNFTVVAAPYRDSSRLSATRAVGEMAEALRDAMTKLNKTSK